MKKMDSCMFCVFKRLGLANLILIQIQKIGYQKLTRIQRICIPPSVKGFDILGSSKTGSGKTLCYVVPIIQKIYSYGWSKYDSVYGVVLIPVRELGLQVYDFFQNFFSLDCIRISLLLGNFSKKKVINEKKINLCSLLIATPGRLLQHMLNNPSFHFYSLKILVLDEVDRILDLGFHKFFFLFLKLLPKKKQFLLFSATLTSRLKNLARFHFRNPFFASVRNKKNYSQKQSRKMFPEVSSNIMQYYTIVSPHGKVDLLFSFLKSHVKKKIIVFFSTKKQVQFFYLIFSKLRWNFSLFYTYGNLTQAKRIANLIGFCKSKKGVLFSTDIMSRGIDFKSIDWIIQMDCPPNVETYVHRIGRTGRLSELGKTLLFLCPFELHFLELIRENYIEISMIYFNKKQIFHGKEIIQKMIKQNKMRFHCIALNAFFSYVRFIFFQTNKKIFNLEKIRWREIVFAFGLIEQVKQLA